MGYYQFGKKHFEYELRGILIRNRLGYLKDITEEWEAQNETTWEHIYSVSTKNRAVDVIIFSSVDRREKAVRPNGDDCVRLIKRIKVRDGYRYARIGKHYRIDTLFKNLEKSLVKASQEVFNLDLNKFTRVVTPGA